MCLSECPILPSSIPHGFIQNRDLHKSLGFFRGKGHLGGSQYQFSCERAYSLVGQLRSVFLFWTWHQVLIVIVEDCKGVFFKQATFSCSSSRVHNASFIVGKWLHPWEWLIGRCSQQLQLQERVFSNWCGHSSLHGCRGVEWLTPNLSHRYMKNWCSSTNLTSLIWYNYVIKCCHCFLLYLECPKLSSNLTHGAVNG